MERYFDKFARVAYGDYIALDITRRARVRDKIISDPYAFYDYIIPEGKRADQVAMELYGDAHLAWVLYLCNRVVDPYFDWPIAYDALVSAAAERYGSYENAVQTIVSWRNNWYDDDSTLTSAAYDALSANVKTYWSRKVDDVGNTLGFERKKLDWKINTNTILEYTLDSTPSFSFVTDERIEIKDGNTNIGFATVLSHSTNKVIVKNTVNAESAAYDLVRTNGDRIGVASYTVLSRNIPLDEVPYWSSVSAWDELSEANEQNKFIRVLDQSRAYAMVEELKSIVS